MTTHAISPLNSPVGNYHLFPSLALSGKAGSGKDTAAVVIQELFPGYKRVAFADKLKDIAALIWGPEGVHDRTKLQQLGLKVREIDADAWVTAALLDVPQWQPIIITDVRFPNEIEAARARGMVTVRLGANRGLRVNRLREIGKLQDEAQLDHVSETALDGHSFDYFVENEGSREALALVFKDIIGKELERRG